MEILINLIDDQYPSTGIKRIRHNCRGVVFDEQKRIALTHLYKEMDDFGGRNYYELPGGGKKPGETTLEAAIREMEEELGVKVTLVKEIGIIHDFYNLIQQENYSYYYVFKVTGQSVQALEEREKGLIDRIEWVSLDQAINYYRQFSQNGVGLLVKRRELPILEEVKKIYQDLTL